MKSTSFQYKRETCPDVDNIFKHLQNAVARAIDEAWGDVKRDVTVPFRDAFDIALDEWHEERAELLRRIDELERENERLANEVEEYCALLAVTSESGAK